MPGRTRTNAATTPLIAAAASSGVTGVRRPSRRGYFRLMGVTFTIFLVYLLFFSRSPKETLPSPGQPVDGQFIRRIVAVGDLHGDYDNALKVLRMAGVVDANGSWTGQVDYFVQTGDIIDRGVDTIKLYSWMERLREQARHAGGEFFSHLGNHEYMNALGDWRYVLQAEIATFGSVEKRQTALSTGTIGSAWAQNYSVVSRIPLHPAAGAPFTDYNPAASASALSHAALSFMHGGLSPTFAYAAPYPSAINTLGASLLRRCRMQKPQPPPHPPAPYHGLPPGATSAEQALYGSDGPLWYRGWATDDEKTVCSRIDTVTQKIGVRRLIMGHTPNFEEMVSRCGGKIIIIDTGISKAYGGVLSALSITYTLTPIWNSLNVSSIEDNAQIIVKAPGMSSSDSEEVEIRAKETRRWIEREEVVAIYPHRRVQLAIDEREVIGNFW